MLRSHKKNGAINKVYLSCRRGKVIQSHANDNFRVSKRYPPKITDCPFAGVVIEERGGWVINLIEAAHNHGPCSLDGLHALRKHEIKPHWTKIQKQLRSGFTPKLILELLKREHPRISFTALDIVNYKKQVQDIKKHENAPAPETKEKQKSYEGNFQEWHKDFLVASDNIATMLRADSKGKLRTSEAKERIAFLKHYDDLKAKARPMINELVHTQVELKARLDMNETVLKQEKQIKGGIIDELYRMRDALRAQVLTLQEQVASDSQELEKLRTENKELEHLRAENKIQREALDKLKPGMAAELGREEKK